MVDVLFVFAALTETDRLTYNGAALLSSSTPFFFRSADRFASLSLAVAVAVERTPHTQIVEFIVSSVF